MLKKVLWLTAVMALFAIVVVGNTGPPASVAPNIIAVAGTQSSPQWLASEAGKEVIHISPMLVTSERDCLVQLVTVTNMQVAQVQPTTANWRDNTGGMAIPALIVQAGDSQAIFAREPVPHWLRV
jgi:hypothetical protein